MKHHTKEKPFAPLPSSSTPSSPASPTFAQGHMSKEEIQQLHLIEFEGTIHVIQTPEDLRVAVSYLATQEILGLDTEKRPTFRKGQYHPVSLLQLATLHEVYLFQLKKTGFPSHLQSLLATPKVKKVGVALHDDFKDLQRISFFKPGGIVYLDQLARERGIIQTGARSLTARFLGRRLSKSSQKSNWARQDLTDKQKIYAATDAWICLKLYPLILGHSPHSDD